MTPKKATNDASKYIASLRQRAEEILRTKAADSQVQPIDELQAVVHELFEHQIELEIQNEELRQSQIELAQSRDRYSDLYEFAPVGYLTLDKDGRVLEANLSAAMLLGVDRQNLVHSNLTKFVSSQSQDDFYQHRRMLAADETKQTCELDMQNAVHTPLVVRLESTPFGAAANRQFRTALIDITERTQAERRLQEQELVNRATLDALSAHVAVIDATGKIVATNRAWRDFAEANHSPWHTDSSDQIRRRFHKWPS